MPRWIRRIFLDILPRILQMRRPPAIQQEAEIAASNAMGADPAGAARAATERVLRAKMHNDPKLKRKFSKIEPLSKRMSSNSFTSFLSPNYLSDEARVFNKDHTPVEM